MNRDRNLRARVTWSSWHGLTQTIIQGLPHTHPRAFTLLGMVIVMVVISVFVAAVTPLFFHSLSYHRAESAARRIKADLELARGRAMATSSNQSVSFIVASDRYELPGLKDFNHPSQNYTIDLSKPPHAASLVAARFADMDDGDVVFNGFGVPDNGGTIVVEAGDYKRTIKLNQQTGIVTIQ